MLIVYISFLLTCHLHISALQSSQLHLKSAGSALNALERLLNFFESNPTNLNLDGLYGLRIAQGQLQILEQLLKSTENYFIDKNQIIDSLLDQTERIANQSLNAIEHNAAFYLHDFFLIASQPFVIEYQARRIDKDLIEYKGRNSEFDEESSDRCFVELLSSSNRSQWEKCSISKACWTMQTAQIGKDYRLTHQLLWFLFAKHFGCINQNHGNEQLNRLEDLFCANIYEDAKINLMNNINQDLFLEQLLVCSMIGYEEFLRLDWFRIVLSWQHPDYDCYSDDSKKIRFHHMKNRHLLFEQEMDHGCLAHKSGLAAGLLATYSRFFLQKN
ncbi:hypothetical protein I4U23_001140 [Adineta vaga]|nr:hypothetical protein I4U23_001140 [Adineta vaga]